MRRKGQYIASFVVFFVISLVTLLLGQGSVARSISGVTEWILTPVQRVMISPIFHAAASSNSPASILEEENTKLKKEIITLKEKQKELEALQKQFKNTPVITSQLVPAQVVGMRAFVPGVSIPQEVMLDKGRKEGILEGMAVIREDHVVGRIIKVSEHVSLVRLIMHPESIITANTLENNALGVVKGQGKINLILQNVVLSEKLSVGDTVITEGDIDTNGLGFPPGLIVGKIRSVAKTPSALFQAAEVESGVDLSDLSTVFIVLP